MSHLRDELRVASWINILIGIWLVIAPFAIGFAEHQAARWNSVSAGAAMVAIAVIRAAMPFRARALSWLTLLLGLWLAFSPFVLGFSDRIPAVLTHVVMGGIVIALSAGSLIGPRHTAG